MNLSSSFKHSFPVTFTSFVNKSGSIGLSIIPVLLVERQLNADESSLVMTIVRGAGLTGVLMGGWLGDYLGLRLTLLLSFLVCGFGLAALPFMESVAALAIAGAIAQMGTSFYPTVARLLLTQMVRLNERREAIAWQRTANNLAQVISYSLGAALGKFGATTLMLIDAATSGVAVLVGAKILPRVVKPSEKPPEAHARINSKQNFYLVALIIASFSFIYDAYMVAAAAQCKILFGAEGLAVFSIVMIINTCLCALLSVAAANYFEKAEYVMPAGLLLMACGALFAVADGQSAMHFYVGSAILSLGEITFSSLAGYVLIATTPVGPRQATTYSTGILMQFSGRIIGSALAFPFIVHWDKPYITLGMPALFGLLLCWHCFGVIKAART